jgi:serine/threonine-protein kinase
LLSGRYRLEATLGQGGMGVVYRGTDLAKHRRVAVKLLRSPDGTPVDDEVAGRFLREAKNTARIQHEHIIEVYDLGKTDGTGLYFVMELLDGESLAQRLRREGRLSPEAAVHIGAQICEALEVAHSAGVIHRDLKPANIMLLARPGDDAFVKVLDFGVAKSFGAAKGDETQLTRAGMLVGTVDYMAPEQITGRAVDGRTDIYALGIMLYRMLAGRPPFADTGMPQLIHAHVNTLPKPLNEVVDGIPSELDLVVLRCLAKMPERRFESMAELGRALVHAIAPPSARSVQQAPAGEPPYDDDDRTAIGKAPPRPQGAPPLPILGDETVSGGIDGPREDETLMMDVAFPRPATATLVPPATGRMPNRPVFTVPLPATSHAAAPHPLEPSDSPNGLRVCAMCQALNAPHALACVGCGLALPLAHVVGAPPPSPYVAPARGFPPPVGPGSVAPWMPAPAPPPSPPSSWQRFLAWIGLRPR